jgi:hypothetical protein
MRTGAGTLAEGVGREADHVAALTKLESQRCISSDKGPPSLHHAPTRLGTREPAGAENNVTILERGWR